MKSWEELLKRARDLAWYGGQRSLVNLVFKGEFEGFRKDMRATEDWEHRFFITTEQIINGSGKVVWPSISVEGDTLEEVSKKALELLPRLN